MRLDQEGAFDKHAKKVIMDSVFEVKQQMSVKDHLAEEMDITLASAPVCNSACH
jgi:hypothetical protein